MDLKSKYKHLFPINVDVEEGKHYVWCGCGKSQNAPFCDKNNCGSKAISFTADLTEEVCLCDCKQTKNPPWCDGSHAKLLLEVLKKHSK